jgi:hypothetical protein
MTMEDRTRKYVNSNPMILNADKKMRSAAADRLYPVGNHGIDRSVIRARANEVAREVRGEAQGDYEGMTRQQYRAAAFRESLKG